MTEEPENPEGTFQDREVAHRLIRAEGVEPVAKINMLLLEGLFFYRKDNPYLYTRLYRRRTWFREFWERYFGLELVVEENVAYRRIDTEGTQPDAGFKNPNLGITGRALFHWSGQGMRERSIIFLLFLKFYYGEIRTRDEIEHGERKFFYHEFFQRVQQSYDEWFQGHEDARPSDGTIFDACKAVFNKLERFRFIEEDSTDEIREGDARGNLGRGYKGDKVMMYRALEGLSAYDPNTLKQPLIKQAYGLEDGDEAEAPDPTLSSFEDGHEPTEDTHD